MSDRKEYLKAYYEENKEKIKAYYEENKEKIKAYREANKEKTTARTKAWYEANKERRKAYSKAWYKKNKERIAEIKKAWRQANKDKVNVVTAKRRASKLNRTPSWITKEDLEEIKDIYRMARRRSEVEGIQYHVDHIIPLQGKNISGLHVPSNLQILRAIDNKIKGNRYGKN